jgi:hypothetical protein
MSTGTYIVTRALQKIQAHSKMKPANPDSLENGFLALNSYISALQDDQIDMGAVPLEAISDELSEPQGTTNYIIANLAIILQPDHPGTQISTELRIFANKGANSIKNTYQQVDIPRPVGRSTLPRGAGNFRRRGRIFFNKDEPIG